MITFDGVTKRYAGGTVAVDDLGLEVPTGEITVFVGPSGCGKTTSLRMINRMVDPTGGRVLLDGVDVTTIDPPTLRRGIGYVIQQAGLFPHRKVVDNVATVPRLLGWERRRARARAMELLERVGLDAALADRYPFQLSGGQQQRVGVARALAADPPVLLMDEPFSAVDPVVRASLQDELLRLQAELRKTIVFVTHDIDEAIKLGDRVAVLRVGGRLAQLDAPARLLAEPADDFVREFLGRDRGIRLLSFVPSGDLPLRTDLTVPVSTTASARGTAEPWLALVDDGGRPLGWIAPRSLPDSGTPADVRPEPYGTFVRGRDPLRSVLDAALLSPSGHAIAVDESGRVEGVVTREALDAALARATGDARG
ncbi:proline/glycine betaine ABC transporter ATP-binding protein [Planomonospora parontospora subsp. parontospora]|uniref:ABC-type quaternary amine transporter n=2 Tax=Planomonospora parontospora TaxID=58119 RepID=A0AA37F2A3_9ACTN|nr:ABC transporter ATP-binding protein [Planomonospora parontospora]GGK49959.1 proline/glycine betaine ABC transporter ATP-binding protein [Planomonospora parontospora]GII07169.1 proline/glycine betaine ABC transporter ATP-binding protein [Planomonospora parontospora subsp. parontospora]